MTPLTFALRNLPAKLVLSKRHASAVVATRYRQRLAATVRTATGKSIAGVGVTFTIAAGGQRRHRRLPRRKQADNRAHGCEGRSGRAASPGERDRGELHRHGCDHGHCESHQHHAPQSRRRPATVAAGAASGESTPLAQRFPVPLAVTVTDRYGNPVAGATVTFAAPDRGAGGHFTAKRRAARVVGVRTNANGIAVAPPFTANDIPGGYIVGATVKRSTAARLLRARQHPVMTMLASPRLGFADLARIASVGIRTRRVRAGLSALGIAIGVAAIVAVLGLSASSQAGLLAEIDKLGTNLLTVQNGQTLFGQTAELPLAAPGMISRIGPVQQVQYTGSTSADVYRSPLIPSVNTNALSVQAASLGLPADRRRNHRRRQLPQRRHRGGAGRRARLRRCTTARHRPSLPRRTDLAGRHVVLPRRHPQLCGPRPGDRLVGARRIPRREALSRLRRASRPPSTSARSRARPPRSRRYSAPPPTRKRPTRST